MCVREWDESSLRGVLGTWFACGNGLTGPHFAADENEVGR